MIPIENPKGTPPSPDTEPSPVSIRFTASPASSIPQSYVNALNDAMEQTENLRHFADLNEISLSINPKLILQQFERVDFSENVYRIIDDTIYHNMVAIHNGDSIKLDASPKLTPQAATIVTLGNEAELHASARAIRHACHGIQNAANQINSAVALGESKKNEDLYILKVQRSFHHFSSEINRLMDDLERRYPQEKISLHEVLYAVRDWLQFPLKNQGKHVSFSQQPSEVKGSVLYSIPWLEAVLVDIAQNIQRQGARTVIVSVKQITIDGRKFKDIVFENDGDHFPDADIVEHGFQDGVSRHPHEQGTGTAMAYHKKILQDHYGGDITLEYRTDENGNRIPGARVRLRLPLAQ